MKCNYIFYGSEFKIPTSAVIHGMGLKPFLGIIGEARVNVLLVNLKLDGIIAE